MAIDSETAKKIARLARLKIPEQDLPCVARDLDAIIAWVGQLDEVDVQGIEPLANVNDASLSWREEDVVTDGDKVDDILAGAPARTADYFTVPKVIE